MNNSPIFYGIRSQIVSGNESQPDPIQVFYGQSERQVLAKMAMGFAEDFLNRMAAVSAPHDHVDFKAVLRALRLTEERVSEVSTSILNTPKEQLEPFSDYLTVHEIVRGYLAHNRDEIVEIAECTPTKVTQIGACKPAHINIIHIDSAGGIAFAREGDDLVGYYAIDQKSQHPHPDDYEWDNEFDFEFITPADAEHLKKAGHGDIVEMFDQRGAVCDG